MFMFIKINFQKTIIIFIIIIIINIAAISYP